MARIIPGRFILNSINIWSSLLQKLLWSMILFSQLETTRRIGRTLSSLRVSSPSQDSPPPSPSRLSENVFGDSSDSLPRTISVKECKYCQTYFLHHPSVHPFSYPRAPRSMSAVPSLARTFLKFILNAVQALLSLPEQRFLQVERVKQVMSLIPDCNVKQAEHSRSN